MPTTTPNLGLYKPLVNNATDQDLWGGYLNDDMDILDSVIPNILPLGVPLPYCGTAAPSGWLLCYGQSLATASYPNLFAIIGYTYGGAGANFNLPDLRGRSIFGKDDMGGSAVSRITNAVSGVDGLTLGAVGGDQRLATHGHGVTDAGHSHTYGAGAQNDSANAPLNGWDGVTPTGSPSTSTATTGLTVNDYSGGSSANIPPAIILNWIMKDGL